MNWQKQGQSSIESIIHNKMCHSFHGILSLTFPWTFASDHRNMQDYDSLCLEVSSGLSKLPQLLLIVEVSQVFTENSLVDSISSPEEFFADPNLERLFSPIRLPCGSQIHISKLSSDSSSPPALQNTETQGQFQEWCAQFDSWQESPPAFVQSTGISHQSPLPSKKGRQGGMWQRPADLSSRTCNFSQP